MFAATFETSAEQEMQQVVCDYRIKCEALVDKKVRKQFASSISSKFRQLSDAFEDIEKEWLLFQLAIISSAAESCGRKRLKVATGGQ